MARNGARRVLESRAVRIEYIRGDFTALKFIANYRDSMLIGNYATLLDAKAACQLEAPQ